MLFYTGHYMIYIYDKYYASKYFSKNKSIYGHLKTYFSPVHRYMFIDLVDRPCLILLHIDVVADVDNFQLEDIVRQYRKVKGSKIIIDTSLEDFVKSSYYDAVAFLIEQNVNPEDIATVTGQNNVSTFVTDYNIRVPAYNINTFEISYYNAVAGVGFLDETVYRPIVPRKLKKHFISFKKNPRFLRRLFHAHMVTSGADIKSYYSWAGLHQFRHYDIDICKQFGIFTDNMSDRLIERMCSSLSDSSIHSDSSGAKEWYIPDEVVQHGGINLIHETHYSLDVPATRPDFFETNHKTVYNRIFLTEKTYKNFVYGLPFINPGIPKSEFMLLQQGYKSWDSFFTTQINNVDYKSCIVSYMDLIDEIANMPLEDLEDQLNSAQSIDYLKQNREVFLEQRQFSKLVSTLHNIAETPVTL